MKNKIFLTLSMVIGLNGVSNSQNTQIPEEAKIRTAPFIFNQEIVTKGETIYNLNCKSCHGDPGKGNYAKLMPIPKDPTSAEYQKNTDGEMFFILKNGRGLMPTFAGSLTEEQRWQVIAYVRSFNKSYQQPPIQVEKEQKVASALTITFHNDSINKKFYTILIDNSGKNPRPAPGIKVSMFVKRTFGNLPVGEVISDGYGVSQFEYLSDIPGDELGNLNLVAKTSNDISQDTVLLVGEPAVYKELLAERTWWNINAKAPIWLIILYTSGLLIALGTIAYILLQMKRIWDLNHNN